MNMSRCLGASILLMLSVEAALLVAAIDGELGTIRLSGDTGDLAVTAARPWNCCDKAICTRSIPPICNCADEVDECAATCNSCVASTTNPSRFVCNDQYVGDPGPICRPWDCCDAAICTKSIPPICHCRDEVEQYCAATCKECAASPSDPSRHVCDDQYRGEPGPKCT